METGCPQPVERKPRYVTGTRACRLQLFQLSGLPVPRQDQNETTHETNAADDRTDGHRMFLVLVDLDRTQLRDVFFRGVTDVPTVSERDDPDRDQDDPEDSCGLHVQDRARENAGLRPGSRSGR
jgi:hypothetical protein